ncbi:MAG: DUF3299 domain-containing protein [Pseudomonadota bacterium]
MLRLSKVLFAALLLTLAGGAVADEPKEIMWEDLVPEGWYPPMPQYSAADFLDESGPAAEQIAVDAPVIDELDDQYIRIPGFILPVEFTDDAISEFLLVPYVGACIHVPPPPSNQIVYVRLAEPLRGTSLFDPVWVEGTMNIEKKKSEYAVSGYTLDGDNITKYEW